MLHPVWGMQGVARVQILRRRSTHETLRISVPVFRASFTMFTRMPPTIATNRLLPATKACKCISVLPYPTTTLAFSSNGFCRIARLNRYG